MLEPFLSEGQLLKEKNKTIPHLSCDLCADKCESRARDLTPTEKRFMVNPVEFSDHSSSDTESYTYDEVDDNIDDLLSD